VRLEAAHYNGAAGHLEEVWVVVQANLSKRLGAGVSAHVVTGRLPRSVVRLTEDPDAWAPRPDQARRALGSGRASRSRT
jgi:hypothetical protein